MDQRFVHIACWFGFRLNQNFATTVTQLACKNVTHFKRVKSDPKNKRYTAECIRDLTLEDYF